MGVLACMWRGRERGEEGGRKAKGVDSTRLPDNIA